MRNSICYLVIVNGIYINFIHSKIFDEVFANRKHVSISLKPPQKQRTNRNTIFPDPTTKPRFCFLEQVCKREKGRITL